MRALAVLSVVLFHIDPLLLPGGFVGVDVFFVISGFVVAHSVYEARHSSLSSYFLGFYRRRLARILPALFAYVIVVAILGAIVIPISEASKHIEITGAASLFGVSNVVLLLRAGDYFATSSEYNSFTHTWSLAVEEQYYLLFPFISYILIVSRTVGARLRATTLLLVHLACIASLIAAAWLTTEWQAFAFYMLPTRFWELGLGLLLRVHIDRRPAVAGRGWGIVGIAGLVSLLASFWWTPVTGFPFPGAIWACASTAIVIAGCWMAPAGPVSRLLSRQPFSFFGDISYSLYLWHWGVLVLMRWTIGVETADRQLLAAAAMMVLAYASYRLVEPLRHDRRVMTWPTLPFFAAFALGGVAIAGVCIQVRAHRSDFAMTASSDAGIWSPYVWPADAPGACPVAAPTTPFAGGERTRFIPGCPRAGGHRLIVMGDSHAGAYRRMMHMVASAQARPITLYTMGGCRLLDTDRRDLVPGCAAFRAAFLRDLLANARAGDILFVPGLYTPRYRDDWGVAVPPATLSQSAHAPLPADAARSLAVLRTIAARGVRVILEAPKPTIPTALFRCADWFNRANGYCARGWEVPRREIERRRAVPLTQIEHYAAAVPHASVWDPLPILCEPRLCRGYRDGKPLYFDTDHLSGYGNELLFDAFAGALRTGESA